MRLGQIWQKMTNLRNARLSTELKNNIWNARSAVKANLHWGVARSSCARFFVCFIAPRSCHAEPWTSAELPDATKQRKNRSRLLLATPQRKLSFRPDTMMNNKKIVRPDLNASYAGGCWTLVYRFTRQDKYNRFFFQSLPAADSSIVITQSDRDNWYLVLSEMIVVPVKVRRDPTHEDAGRVLVGKNPHGERVLRRLQELMKIKMKLSNKRRTFPPVVVAVIKAVK